MGIDNGIFILQTSGPEFRVAYCAAIDNIYSNYITENDSWTPNPTGIASIFKDTKVHEDLEAAWDEAMTIESDHEYTEYGSCLITEFADYHFDDLLEKAKRLNSP